MDTILLSRFQKYIEANSLVTPQSKILVAVSGGVDSMVLLSLFVRSGYSVGVAHCNFQLRGRESDEDDVMVERETKKYDVPLYAIRFDTEGEMERTGESVQIATRRLRYTWFEELCKEHGYTTIAIAHHADDSIETFFINMLRGTGLQGLTGIRMVNERVIRPLLFASRKDILDYSTMNKIAFREDSSNRATKYLRNKIRLGIVPLIKEINPKFTQVMEHNLKRLTDAQIFINNAVEGIRAEVVKSKNGLIIIEPAKIDPDYPFNFVVYELMKPYGFKGDVVDDLCTVLRSDLSGRRFYSREYVAYSDRGNIVITQVEQEDTCDMTVERTTHRIYCGNSVIYMDEVDIDTIDTLVQPDNIALLDADKLTFPMTVRRWQEGDTFVPLGMSGSKKVSDFLIDDKVSLADKRRQFVMVSGEDIVWLIGRRIDDRYKVAPTTERVLKLIKEVI